MSKRAMILKRVSTDKQEENYSPESQESSCREYAESLGYTVTHILMEVRSGAKEFDDRPVLGDVLTHVRNRTIDALIIHKVNRATRAGGIHTLMLAHECERNNVELHFVEGQVHGQVDIQSPAGRIMLLIAGDQASEERKTLLEQMNRGLRTRAVVHGRPRASHKCIYGFSWVDEIAPSGKRIPKARAEIFEPEAMIVRRIFHEVCQGVSITQITERLRASGIPNSLGGINWSRGFISRLIADTRYKGIGYTYSRKTIKSDAHKKGTKDVLLPESERVRLPDGTYPPIVSDDIWEIANHRLGENKRLSDRNNKQPSRALLRGYVECGDCERKMAARSHRDKARYACVKSQWNEHLCSHPTITTDLLDSEVWEILMIVLSKPDVVREELRRLAEDGKDQAVRADLALAEKLLRDLRLREKNLIAMRANAADNEQAAEMDAQLIQAGKHRQDAQQSVLQLQRKLDMILRQSADTLNTADTMLYLAERLNDTTPEERRVIVRGLVVKVRVWPRTHSPQWELILRIPHHITQGIAGESVSFEFPAPSSLEHKLARQKWLESLIFGDALLTLKFTKSVRETVSA